MNNLDNENLNSQKDFNQSNTINFDISRMNAALKSETFTIPNGLNRDEIIKFICNSAKENKKE